MSVRNIYCVPISKAANGVIQCNLRGKCRFMQSLCKLKFDKRHKLRTMVLNHVKLFVLYTF